mmetsp:Transcript_8728/g.14252  ORF Transcript_8728/g.14252 Transcript_8728/m.14252 type:complete len:228 (+) Transcript_8728:1743-2426(+)
MKKRQIRMRRTLFLIRLGHILLQSLVRLACDGPQHLRQPFRGFVLLFEGLDVAHHLLQIVADTARAAVLGEPLSKTPRFVLAHSPQKSVLDVIAPLGNAGVRIPDQRVEVVLRLHQMLPRHDALVVPFEPRGQRRHVIRVKLPWGHAGAAPRPMRIPAPTPLRQLQPLPQLLLAIHQKVHTRQEAGDHIVRLGANVAHHLISAEGPEGDGGDGEGDLLEEGVDLDGR